MLHGLEHETVLPVGEVLHGGDAVGERVRDGDVRAPGVGRLRSGGGMCASISAIAGVSRMIPVGSPLRVVVDLAAAGARVWRR